MSQALDAPSSTLPAEPPRRPRRLVLGVAAVAVLALVAGVTAWLVLRPTASGLKPPTAGGLKPPTTGLVDRDGAPSESAAGLVSAVVVNAKWSELQPSAGGPITTDNEIDRTLAQVRQLNRAHPDHPIGVKIRLFAGRFAPAWVNAASGGTFKVTDTHSKTPTVGSVGRFWLPAYGAAWDDLQAKLAARYDSVPEIQDVTISRCMTIYAEPFLRQANEPATLKAMLGAGYTAAADERCQREQVDSARAWRHTHTSLSFNPYQRVEPDGRVTIDLDFTLSMMSYCRAQLGERCVLENNSLRLTKVPPSDATQPYQRMLLAMKELGAPITFQTATARKLPDLVKTLAVAGELGATAVELPGGYQQSPPEELRSSDERLRQAGEKLRS